MKQFKKSLFLFPILILVLSVSSSEETANGVCRFTLPAKNYEIHTLMVPAGYEGDMTIMTQAPAQGGELTFTLTKK